MLAFIDESGIPVPNSASDRPVVVAECFTERDARTISRRIHALKQYELGGENVELKGSKLLNRNSYLNSNTKRIRAEKFFATLRGLPITVFATVLRGPFTAPAVGNVHLENRFRFLVQRIEMLGTDNNALATVVFDGLGNRFHELGRSFSNYLFRSNEGRGSTHITDTPLFVDSKSAVGIQIADMCAYAIRVYQENQLFSVSPSDDYLVAVRRWYRIVQRMTRDMSAPNGEIRYGIQFLTTGVR
ncbi:MAG: DUF3800 domain-containing protein [Chloroflexota bacterium]|nr:DUF3800 domain-containing protein [Chloroflexota bacterium]